jgi:hypothetical protein
MSKRTRSRSSPKPTVDRIRPPSILKKPLDCRAQSKQPKIPVRFDAPKTRSIITELDWDVLSFESATRGNAICCVRSEYNATWLSCRRALVGHPVAVGIHMLVPEIVNHGDPPVKRWKHLRIGNPESDCRLVKSFVGFGTRDQKLPSSSALPTSGQRLRDRSISRDSRPSDLCSDFALRSHRIF